MPDDHEEKFWSHAEAFLERDGVARGTMMGYPCLRIDGGFFASCDRKNGDLIVKLSKKRVDALIEDGRGSSFAPAGKRFREWVSISSELETSWDALLGEALEFVTSSE